MSCLNSLSEVQNVGVQDFLHQHGGLKNRLLPSDLSLLMASLATKDELERAQSVAKDVFALKATMNEKQKTIDNLQEQVMTSEFWFMTSVRSTSFFARFLRTETLTPVRATK